MACPYLTSRRVTSAEIALAKTRKATLVTSDKDFECVATLLKVLWL